MMSSMATVDRAEQKRLRRAWERRLKLEGLGVDETRWEKPEEPNDEPGLDACEFIASDYVDLGELEEQCYEGAPSGLAEKLYAQTVIRIARRARVEAQTPRTKVFRALDSHRERARRWGVLDTLTKQQVWLLLDAANGQCVYCAERHPLTVDHIEPMSAGGANAIWNVAPACWPCNKRKGTSQVEDWCTRAGLPLPDVLERIRRVHEVIVACLGEGVMRPTEVA